ncbi:hypothetical protein D9615_008171 [Tricholomella constricta]|uniref:GmrSD restriction endonucleases N-terminal domain-containing protein n=1 Tax=Tricholomella constricta TaxID=117010 RepID=A0A8H5H3P8_9AGAR|nr:hypothetical protein D9615_008171 [Tricholomella constricta]
MSLQFDDDSDLTDLSDDEPSPLQAPSIPKTEAVPAKKVADNVPHLPKYRHVTYSTVAIHALIRDKMVDLDPEYQRGVVWSETKQGDLIDSLMHHYVVYPIVFAIRPISDGAEISEIRVCIDGKQRITAIQQFMDNKIPYKDSRLSKDVWYSKVPQGRKGHVISDVMRMRFSHTQLAVYEYDAINDYDERERVQNGVALSAHERLRAINGLHADMVREMYRATTCELRKFFFWEDAKGKDFFMLSQLACLINHHLSDKKGDYPATELKLQRVETYLHGKTAPGPQLRAAVLGVVDTLNSLIANSQWSRSFEGIKPMWFVMAGFLIYLHRSRFSLAQIAEAVGQMKDMGRTATAAKAYKDLAVFVVNKAKTLKLKGDGNDIPASSVLFNGQQAGVSTASASASTSRQGPADAAPSVASTSASTGGNCVVQNPPKRKRSKDDSDEEEDADVEDQAPKRKTFLTRRKIQRLPVDSDDDDDVPLIQSAPHRMKSAAAQTSVTKLGSTKATASARKATTTVKRTAKAKTSGSAARAATNQIASTSASTSTNQAAISSQVGKPSVRPAMSTRTKKVTTPSAILTGESPPERPASQGKTPPATTSQLNSQMPTPPVSSGASATPGPLPLPTPRALNSSQPPTPMFTPGSNRPSHIYNIKAEPRHSPVCTPPPHFSASNRLAPVRAARARIAAQQEQQPLIMSASASTSAPSSARWQDPRRRMSSNHEPVPDPPSPSESDLDADLKMHLDKIESILNTVPSTRAPELRPHASTDVFMANGTRTRGGNVSSSLNGFDPLAHLVAARPQKSPPFAVPWQHARSQQKPTVDPINTDVDLHRRVSGPSSRGQHQPQTTPMSGNLTSRTSQSQSSTSLFDISPIARMTTAMASRSISRSSRSLRDYFESQRERERESELKDCFRLGGRDRSMDSRGSRSRRD